MAASILPRIAPQVIMAAVVASAVVVLSQHDPELFRNFTAAPFTLLGIALSIFLGSRNNACYDRWWEARRQLGALIGETRSSARWTMSLPGGDRARRERAVLRVIGYTYALMAHLRGDTVPEEVARYTPDAALYKAAANLPDALLRATAGEMSAMLHDGEFGEIAMARFDDRLTSLAGMQVACERIRSTPTPFTYSLLLHRTAYAFCFLLPFGVAGTLRWASPLLCGLIAYAFFGLDALGDELQEPFGTGMNALPLYAMARTVEISLLEAVGETDLPAPAQPVQNILH